jgi:hypothetical protein
MLLVQCWSSRLEYKNVLSALLLGSTSRASYGGSGSDLVIVSGTAGIAIQHYLIAISCRLCVVYTSRPRRCQGYPLLVSPAPALYCSSLVDKAYYLHRPRSQVDLLCAVRSHSTTFYLLSRPITQG